MVCGFLDVCLHLPPLIYLPVWLVARSLNIFECTLTCLIPLVSQFTCLIYLIFVSLSGWRRQTLWICRGFSACLLPVVFHLEGVRLFGYSFTCLLPFVSHSGFIPFVFECGWWCPALSGCLDVCFDFSPVFCLPVWLCPYPCHMSFVSLTCLLSFVSLRLPVWLANHLPSGLVHGCLLSGCLSSFVSSYLSPNLAGGVELLFGVCFQLSSFMCWFSGCLSSLVSLHVSPCLAGGGRSPDVCFHWSPFVCLLLQVSGCRSSLVEPRAKRIVPHMTKLQPLVSNTCFGKACQFASKVLPQIVSEVVQMQIGQNRLN